MGRKFRKIEGMNPNLKLVRGNWVKMHVLKDWNYWINRFVKNVCQKLPAIDIVYFFLKKSRVVHVYVHGQYVCLLSRFERIGAQMEHNRDIKGPHFNQKAKI